MAVSTWVRLTIRSSLDLDIDLSLLRPLPGGLEPAFSVHWEVPLAVDPARLDAVIAVARQGLDWGTKGVEQSAPADSPGE